MVLVCTHVPATGTVPGAFKGSLQPPGDLAAGPQDGNHHCLCKFPGKDEEEEGTFKGGNQVTLRNACFTVLCPEWSFFLGDRCWGGPG